ncbi:MAG: hypothetical protein RR058_06235 [Oscillospiraceae bacterium]
MKKKLFLVFAIGAAGYSLLEIIWRSYTHWTMTLTGGFCLAMLFLVNEKLRMWNLFKKALAGAAIITASEFAVGVVVNLWLGWNVWDYSARRGNFFGQICPLFTLVWFLICIPVFFALGKIEKRILSKTH